MPEGWTWDPSLFDGAAPYYVRGRLPYAPGLAAAVAAALELDGRGRLLDVGCGPGTVTLALAPYVEEAVGVDPDAGMLAEAARRAERAGTPGVRWHAARAEELPAGLGAFRAVTFAQSFHWTDRDRVAATVRDMLEPGGACVLIADAKTADGTATAAPRAPHAPAGPPAPAPASASTSAPAPPYEAIAALVRRYLGPRRRAGQGVLVHGTPGGEEAVLARAGFGRRERLVVPGGEVVRRDEDSLVAWTLSRSDSAPHLFGGRLAAFEEDLRGLLRDALAGGAFAEHLPDTEVRIWRKDRT